MSESKKAGVYDGITNEDYHSGDEASSSMLKLLYEWTPAHLKASRDAREEAMAEAVPGEDAEAKEAEPEKVNKEFILGSAFHAIVLEPDVFAKEFCLALRPQDVPGGVIESRDELVALVEALNADRLDKLSVSGTKDELVARIRAEVPGYAPDVLAAAPDLDAMKLADLKAILTEDNKRRPGKLKTSAESMEALAATLAEHGKPVKVWKLVQAEWMANNSHRKVLTEDQWNTVHRMRESVLAHPLAAKILQARGKAELSCYSRCPITDTMRRVRPDWWTFSGTMADLKSTNDASLEGFRKSVAKFGYDIQHPYYVDTALQALKQSATLGTEQDYPTKVKNFAFIAVEKKAPYAVGVYVLDAVDQCLGRAKYRDALETYTQCQISDLWPAYSSAAVTLSLPEWHRKVESERLGIDLTDPDTIEQLSQQG